MARVRNGILLHEERPHGLAGLEIAVRTIAAHTPGVPIIVNAPGLDEQVRGVFGDVQNLSIQTAVPRQSGWSIKAELLLHQLDQGFDSVIWVDSDFLILDGFLRDLHGLSLQTLAIGEETHWGPSQGSAVRTRSWGLEVGRSLKRSLNGGLIRVTSSHRPLLRDWMRLMDHPRYTRAQASGTEGRPAHLISDQEVLTALLGSTRHAQVPLHILRRGIDIAQLNFISGYSAMERLRCAVRGSRPHAIHALGHKPWNADRRNLLADWRNARSSYVACAKSIRRSLRQDTGWMDAHRRWLDRTGTWTATSVWRHGLLLATLDQIARTTKRAVDHLRGRRRWPTAEGFEVSAEEVGRWLESTT
jgi:hypothetical protein